MRQRIPLYYEPLPATMSVVPIFPMRPPRIVAEIDVIKPRIHVRRAMLRANFRCIPCIRELTMITFAAERAVDPNHRPPLLRPRVRSRTLFLNQMTG